MGLTAFTPHHSNALLRHERNVSIEELRSHWSRLYGQTGPAPCRSSKIAESPMTIAADAQGRHPSRRNRRHAREHSVRQVPCHPRRPAVRAVPFRRSSVHDSLSRNSSGSTRASCCLMGGNWPSTGYSPVAARSCARMNSTKSKRVTSGRSIRPLPTIRRTNRAFAG